MYKIPLFKPDYSANERNTLLKAFDSGWLAMGNFTRRFEEEFAGYINNDTDKNQNHYKETAAVSNCTAALHLALLCAGVKKGDEVLVPATTFVADINVVMMTGAKPVVVDSTSLLDWNVSYDDFSKKITPKTRAAIVVHFAGYPFDTRIPELCRKRGIILIEDCAHAIGSFVGASGNRQSCGTLGDMAAFSFYANKNLAVGEGGMFVGNPEMVQRARLLRSHGMTALSLERNLNRMISYDVMMPGLNYRITELASSIGIEQLKKLQKGNEKRKKIVEKYIALLSKGSLIIPFQEIPAGITPSYHIFPVLLPEGTDRRDFMAQMAERGIQTSIHYPSFRHFTAYQKIIKDKTPVSDVISNRAVTLPLYPGLSLKEVEYVCKSAVVALTSN